MGIVKMNTRYRNRFSGEMVTTAERHYNMFMDATAITYRRDTPQYDELGNELYEFIKPEHIFMQCYEEVTDPIVPLPSS